MAEFDGLIRHADEIVSELRAVAAKYPPLTGVEVLGIVLDYRAAARHHDPHTDHLLDRMELIELEDKSDRRAQSISDMG